MPQLKIYEAKEASDSYLPRNTRELLGSPLGRDQGSWYIAAHTAAEAAQIAVTADIPFADSPRRLRVAHGNNLELLKSAGYLATPGEVLTHLNRGRTPVAKLTDNGWLIIGHFAYDAKARNVVFQPEEA